MKCKTHGFYSLLLIIQSISSFLAETSIQDLIPVFWPWALNVSIALWLSFEQKALVRFLWEKAELALSKVMNNERQKNKIIELSRLLVQALEVNNIANILGYQRQLKEAFIEYKQKQLSRNKKSRVMSLP